MKASTILLGAALVALLVFAIYAVSKEPAWAQKSYWTAHCVESPWRVYQRSAGDFDDAAALALQRATGRPAPTAGDHILAATVITRNILAQEHRPARDGRWARARTPVPRCGGAWEGMLAPRRAVDGRGGGGDVRWEDQFASTHPAAWRGGGSDVRALASPGR